MLFYYHNKITSNYQYFRVDHITDHMNPHFHTRFTSLRTAKDFFCSHGQSRMYSYRAFSVLIKDFPNLPKEKKYIEFSGHRFRCISCGETITEDIPCQCPFTRVTWEMAWWIIHLLKGHMSLSTRLDFYLLIIHSQNFREKPIIPSFSIFFPKTKKQRAKARCFQKTGQNIGHADIKVQAREFGKNSCEVFLKLQSSTLELAFPPHTCLL